MTIGLQALLVVQILSSNIVKRHAIPTSAFIACVMCYLIVDWEPMQNYSIFYLLLAPAFCLTFAFWLFSRALFDDYFQLRWWMIWVLFVVAAFRYFFYFLHNTDWFESSIKTESLGAILEYSISLVFVVLGIVAAAKNRKDDLIAIRYEFRNIFVWLSATLIFLTILSEIAYQQSETPMWLEFFQKMVITLLTFYFAMKSLKLKPGFFLVKERKNSALPFIEPDKNLLDLLFELMESQKIWLSEGLTIRQLAEKMDVKEYRLRQTINQYLGFRNFNDYLNSFRIAQACKLLQDPSKKDFTILEIAYEMGYSSISPFNKAFKDITGMTPSEWRRDKQK